MTRLIFSLIFIVLLVAAASADPDTDRRAQRDRAAVVEVLGRLATAAEALGHTAKASDDRGVRKKLAPHVVELADDLITLVGRAKKDVPLETVSKELAAIDRDATVLIELADEADDKGERKSLRSQAVLLEQAVASASKSVDALIAKADDRRSVPRLSAMSGEAFKRLLETVEGVNTDADKLSMIRQAGDANGFSAVQIGALMDLINVDSVKVDVASSLWAHLSDPQNGFLVFGKLELEGSKAELRRRIGTR